MSPVEWMLIGAAGAIVFVALGFFGMVALIDWVIARERAREDDDA